MNNYAAIVVSIPTTKLNAALAELAVVHPLTRSDGTNVMKNGAQQTATGKFMTDTNIMVCFDAIKNETTAVAKGYNKQTYVSLGGVLGLALTTQLETAVDAAIVAGDMAPWISQALNGAGINASDPQISGLLDSLKDKHGIDQLLIDAVAALAVETVPLFPGLKPGHVQNALQAHALGV